MSARVAALYDIHGNLPALNAALDAVVRAHASHIVLGGDVVLGPMPVEVLARLDALDVPLTWIRGNCDRLVVAAARETLADTLPAPLRMMVEWTAAQLAPAQIEFLAQLPLTCRLDVDALGAVRFCHATPRSDDEILSPWTPDETAHAMLDGVEERVLVCGHTHVQWRRELSSVEIVNAGSVGMSTGAAEAQWLLLGDEARWQQTPYDAAPAIAAIGATAYPGIREFIGGYIKRSPTPEMVWSVLEPNGEGAIR